MASSVEVTALVHCSQDTVPLVPVFPLHIRQVHLVKTMLYYLAISISTTVVCFILHMLLNTRLSNFSLSHYSNPLDCAECGP